MSTIRRVEMGEVAINIDDVPYGLSFHSITAARVAMANFVEKRQIILPCYSFFIVDNLPFNYGEMLLGSMD